MLGFIRVCLLGLVTSFAMVPAFAADLTAEDLLNYIQKALSTCNEVSKVTRDGSNFVVHEFTMKYEFDLDDLNADPGHSVNPYINLRCTAPACIATYSHLGGKWREGSPMNVKAWKCNEIAHNLSKVVRGYRKNF